MKKYFLIAAGFASLSAGIAGIFLPVLPTTPFVLLAAACFLRSSQRLYRWITAHRVFGPYIENYCRYRAVSIPSKIASIALLWTVMLSTIFFAVSSYFMRILLFAIGLGVTIHLIALKTLTPEMLQKSRE